MAGFSAHAIGADPLKDYRNALELCAGEKIRNLDDGLTPANTVANVLLGVCKRRNKDLYLLAASGRSTAYMQGFEKAAAEQFTMYVLSHRAIRNAPARK